MKAGGIEPFHPTTLWCWEPDFNAWITLVFSQSHFYMGDTELPTSGPSLCSAREAFWTVSFRPVLFSEGGCVLHECPEGSLRCLQLSDPHGRVVISLHLRNFTSKDPWALECTLCWAILTWPPGQFKSLFCLVSLYAGVLYLASPVLTAQWSSCVCELGSTSRSACTCRLCPIMFVFCFLLAQPWERTPFLRGAVTHVVDGTSFA